MENGIKALFIDELCEIFSAEEQLVDALPEVARAAESSELKNALESHFRETKNHIKRLEKIFHLLRVERSERFCVGMKGLIQECKDVIRTFPAGSPVRDAALISKAQRIEHYEISAYGTLKTFARELEYKEVADLLKENEDEEGGADKKLTKVAQGGFIKSGINRLANV